MIGMNGNGLALQLVANATSLDLASLLLGRATDRDREIDDAAGYPASVTAELLHQLYLRDPLAKRIVELWPLECWSESPWVYESETPDEVTPFEQAWDSSLRGGQSWHKEEAGSAVWEALARLDVLAGVGVYGVGLLGLDDGLPLSEPVRGIAVEGSRPADNEEFKTVLATGKAPSPRWSITVNAAETAGRKLLFLRPLPEVECQVVRWETNRTSPRFGKPTAYLIGPRIRRSAGIGTTEPQGAVNVHWTRVLHVADGITSSEVIGSGRLLPVLNAVLDAKNPRRFRSGILAVRNPRHVPGNASAGRRR